jgi:hypothetical protein
MAAGQSLINSIPGFTGLSSSSSDLIKSLMSGQLTTGERSAIYNAGAERGIMGGMPGSSASGGSLFANADLRNIGLASGQRQQQGFQDFLSMLQGYSGTVAPSAGQESSQQAQQDLQSQAQAFQAAEANKQRKAAMEMQAAEANARNYWDPRWKSKNPYTPGSLPATRSFFGTSMF